MSAAFPRTTVASTSPVAGLMASKVSPDCEGTSLPSINSGRGPAASMDFRRWARSDAGIALTCWHSGKGAFRQQGAAVCGLITIANELNANNTDVLTFTVANTGQLGHSRLASQWQSFWGLT